MTSRTQAGLHQLPSRATSLLIVLSNNHASALQRRSPRQLTRITQQHSAQLTIYPPVATLDGAIPSSILESAHPGPPQRYHHGLRPKCKASASSEKKYVHLPPPCGTRSNNINRNAENRTDAPRTRTVRGKSNKYGSWKQRSHSCAAPTSKIK